MSENSSFIQYTFKLSKVDPWRDLLIAELGELAFEAFEEITGGFKAYINSEHPEPDVSSVIERYQSNCEISYACKEIEQENWNAKWEASFDPVIVNDECIVKATFHKIDGHYEYTITLNPKMSFGTGHHQTTYMMLKYLLNMQVEGKSVLDMGSGTGVLAILASMMGAEAIDAIDIDDWAYHNCIENLEINGVANVNVFKGDVKLLEERSFNVILANINKNILMADMGAYSGALRPQGELVISGFYQSDESDLINKAQEFNLNLIESDTLDNWAALKFRKL